MIDRPGPDDAEMGIAGDPGAPDIRSLPKIKAFLDAIGTGEIPPDLMREGQDSASRLRELSPEDIVSYFMSDLTPEQRSNPALVDEVTEEALHAYNDLVSEVPLNEAPPEVSFVASADESREERKRTTKRRKNLSDDQLREEFETPIDDGEKIERATKIANQLVQPVDPKKNPPALVEIRASVFQEFITKAIVIFDQNGWIFPNEYFDKEYRRIYPERIKALQDLESNVKKGTGIM